ncbi:MAG: hypothetical protein AAGA05_15180, partial [Pseudomonadota bacterium]
MRPVLFLGLLLLSACAAPHPHFRGVEVTRVEVDSYVFDIPRPSPGVGGPGFQLTFMHQSI